MDRIKKILETVLENKLDAALISSVPNIIYLTGYSGFSYLEREAFLVVAQPQGLTHKTPGVFGYIITDGRYSEAVSKILLNLPKYELLEISNKNSLDDIFKSLSKKIKKLGIEENNISLSESKKLKKYFKLVSLKDLENLRIVKEESEILKIQKACEIGDKAFNFILKKLKEGVSEKQIAFDLEYFIKQKRADISFPPIVAFGKNSSIPHHQTGNTKLSKNQIVLLDFGVKFENYCSDMTRTIFFGKADDKFKKIYKTVLTAQQKAIEKLSHLGGGRLRLRSHDSSEVNSRGIKATDVDAVARNYIINQHFPTIPHSLGHGVGIEVHEPPRLSPKSKDILKPGMVFSIEPGIYISGYGGVRIEDLVVLENTVSRRAKPSSGQSLRTASGRRLTHSPKSLMEI
ncbi:MAG: aminopeptidase P family protein [bacterium]|nr:aminopeptidase P family protein [bacterium]